ncbi:MAG: GNAT family N-acetyltransferase [Anaerolineae bacterium]|nr:GNAT family N-acetyltransferase [Anaerolineae bacterium]
MMNPFQLRPYQKGDEIDINQAFNEAFNLNRSLEEWRWKFASSSDDHWIIVAVDQNNEIVAQYAAIEAAFQVNGRIFRAAQPVDVFCLRRPGALEHEVHLNSVRTFFRTYGHAERLALLYGFPGQRALRLGQLELGYGEATPVPIWRYPLARFSWPFRRGQSPYEMRGGCQPTDLDALWQRCAQRYPAAVIRNGHWLTRRYVSRPHHIYKFVTGWQAGRMVAWAVWQIAGDTLQWIDLLWDGEAVEVLAAIQKKLEHVGRQAKVQQLEMWVSGDALVTEFLNTNGWQLSEHPHGLYAVARSFHPDIDGSDVIRHFYFTMGDMDLV